MGSPLSGPARPAGVLLFPGLRAVSGGPPVAAALLPLPGVLTLSRALVLAAALLLSGCGPDSTDERRDQAPEGGDGGAVPRPGLQEEGAEEAPAAAPDLESCLRQARSHYEAGRFEDAASTCLAGLALDSTAVPLYNLLATTYGAQGRYALGLEALQRALHFQPDYPLAYLNLGGVYTKLGRYAEAERHLRRAVELAPDKYAIRRRLAEVYLGTGRPAEALAELDEALRLLPEDATLYFFRGRALEENGQTDAALEAFEHAGHLDIGFAETWYRAGVLARKLGHGARARAAMDRFQHLQGIGRADPDAPKKMKKLRSSIMNTPVDPVPHLKLGLLFGQHGYMEEALSKFDKAFRLQPENVSLMRQIGGALARLGRPEEALAYYRVALSKAPDSVPTLLSVGDLLVSIQRRDEALELYLEACDVAPEDPRGWYALGRELAGAGRINEARHILRQGLSQARLEGPWQQKLEGLLAELPGED